MGTFSLKIKLGNDAMNTNGDISKALDVVAGDLLAFGPKAFRGGIYDVNGNKVGEWKVTGRKNNA